MKRLKAEELKAFDNSGTKARISNQWVDVDYLQSHYKELLSKYWNQWVMISGGKLIGSESNPDRLMKRLSRSRRDDMLVYYLADPKEVILKEELIK